MAGTYTPNGDILVQGINLKVRVDPDDETGSNPQVIAFVQDASVRKSIQVQRAEVIGEILPASLDPTSIQTTMTLRGFIPTKTLVDQGVDSVRGGGAIHLKTFNPDDSRLLETKVATKIPYLDLYDDKHKSILVSTSWVIVTGYNESSSGKGYVTADITLEGIGCNNGPDYGD
jgi:hypothetical protein